MADTNEGDAARPGANEGSAPGPVAGGDAAAKSAPVEDDAAKPAPVEGEAAKPAPVEGDAAEPAPVEGDAAEPAPVEGDAVAAAGTPDEAEGKKPSPLFLYLVVIPVGLLLLYGLVAAAVSGRYPTRALAYQERILRDPESEDAAAAALELAEMSVGQRFEAVARAFKRPKEKWERIPIEPVDPAEGGGREPRFGSPPLEAEQWRLTVGTNARPYFLVVHGNVVAWSKD